MLSEPDTSAAWQPLLDGASAARAWRVIDGVARALAPAVENAALDTGAAGRALFFAYLDRARGGHEAEWRCALAAAVAGVAALSTRPGLFAGFTGVAWAVQHLDNDGSDDANDEIDAFLIDIVNTWRGENDLVSGLCGFGIYALSRLDYKSGPPLLAAVVNKLAANARIDGNGASWWTRPEWLPRETRALRPDGYCNLGLAHGVPAVALVLAAATRHRVAYERARTLAAEASRFVLTPRFAATTAFLPSYVGDTVPSRSAWCYGDPGAAAALVAATTALGDAALLARARALAYLAVTRPEHECQVIAAGICHGAAGLALIFHQLYYATGDVIFARASRRWYEATLNYARDDIDGGFASAYVTASGMEWRKDLSLVGGAAGIGLALLAALTPIAPRWITMLGLML
jgi:lantibiotic modifying enzyme